MVSINKRTRNIISIVIIGILTLILIPILVINIILIVRGNSEKDMPPQIFGYAPLVVSSGSMEGNNSDSFDEGALIFIKLLDSNEKQQLKENDIVCFKVDDIYVTHRIITVNKDSNQNIVSMVTMGDANNGITDGIVPIENVIGICTNSINGLGNFALFMQSPIGILVFIGIPIVAFIVYDILKMQKQKKFQQAKNNQAQQALELRLKEEEIKRLQAMLDEKNKE